MSLCSPDFSFIDDLSGILRAGLSSPNFNFHIANPETRFELAQDQFDIAKSTETELVARDQSVTAGADDREGARQGARGRGGVRIEGESRLQGKGHTA